MRIQNTIPLTLTCFVLMLLPLTVKAQLPNDLPCNATDLGVLSIENPLILTGETNIGARGENKGWYNNILEKYSCKGTNNYESTVYYKFSFDGNVSGATITITPRSGILDAILLEADDCGVLQDPEERGTFYYEHEIGNSCNKSVGETIELGGYTCFQPIDNTLYILVGSDYGGGTFDIQIDPITPTGCDGCLNGNETTVDGPQPFLLDLQALADTEICLGEEVPLQVPAIEGADTYVWEQIVNGVSSTFETSEPTFLALSAGTYRVSVSDGCANYLSNTLDVAVTDTLSAETILITGELQFCEGESVQLSVPDNPETTITWYKDDIQLTMQQPKIEVRESGTYYAISSSLCDTDISEEVQVQVNPLPEPPDIGPASICIGESLDLGQIGDYVWFTDPAGSIVLPSKNGILEVNGLLEDTLFFVAASNNSNCLSDLVPVEVKVNPLPEIRVTGDTIVRIGEMVELSASGGTAYQWMPAEYLSDYNIADPVARPLEDITYTVSVETAAGCSGTAEVNIEVVGQIQVPNAFTPNGDGINDTWKIEFIEASPRAQVQIINRYGQEVYRAAGTIEPWDGFFQGSALPEDTYFYKIILNWGNPPITGSINLLR